jgi:Flp pilus assembly CpaE family ATPase
VLLDPGRRVALGESWQLDRSLSRRYLRDQGVRVMKLGAPGTATLREADGAEDAAYVIEYSIPVEWFVLDRMPPGARASETTARFEGEIRLPATPGASIAHTSRLELAMDGIAGDVGAAHIVTWHVKSLKISSQRSVRVESLSRRGADGAPISRSDPRTHLADRWTPGAR